MSLLFNLLQGNGPFELKDQHSDDVQFGSDRSQSQTTEAKLYSLVTSEGVKVQVLDTPGLADTRGIEEDKKHKKRIYHAIQELITVIDGVMIIANGRVERLTVATDYTLNILATLFPRSIVDNIGIIFTNTDASEAGLNFQMQSLPPELRRVDYWCLDNPLSLYKNYQALKAKNEFGPRQESRLKRTLNYSYEDTVETLDCWLGWLDDRKAVPTSASNDLYQKSSHIESRLFATVISIASLSSLESQLQGISSALRTDGAAREVLESLKQKPPPKIWVLEETLHHNTICTVPGCHSNCHTDCSLGLSDSIAASCKAFKTPWILNSWLPSWSTVQPKCNQAKCGHEAQAHRYYPRAYKQKASPAYRRIVQDLKNAPTEKARLEGAKIRIKQETLGIIQEIERSKREIPELIGELTGLSLSPNHAGYILSALDILNMRQEHLISRPDSCNELAVISDGIKAFETQLSLIRENEVGRIVETSARGTGSQT
ncbi:hypothetical protein FRC11_005388 [Ceratobasidium sp. 423]|nr:hypothetical protein FRC11_005388 [Ceratobasidium sp. 423]